jgi:hypothetical protein
MTSDLPYSLDQLAGWRREVEARADGLLQWLGRHDLVDETAGARLRALRERLARDKLTVAFVAEFSRGKSELINALFFADTGLRILPATPGRTTMCPVELGWTRGEPPAMRLLPIDTRLDSRTLADWRDDRDRWTVVPLAPDAPPALAAALGEVTRTTTVDVDTAIRLGFWSTETPHDNPPLGDDGLVEVPAWRHALINYPHPLLERGLVVIDTPGLNAIGAEPELTLNLLPSAHATVFILAADTGVTRSDLAVWRDHLGAQADARYVVLNKVDALADPLAAPGQVDAQIAGQLEATARLLGIDPRRVFPLSARQGLAARIGGDAAATVASGLPALAFALQDELLPRRRQLLEAAVEADSREVEAGVERRLADRRRQLAEQVLELRGLRGKSTGKVRVLLARVEEESAEFERCAARLQALRMIHHRMLKETLAPLSGERLRVEFGRFHADLEASLLRLGGRRAFAAMCERLREKLRQAAGRLDELRTMLDGAFAKLNAEYGFALVAGSAPGLDAAVSELDLIERSYARYLGLSQALRLSDAGFMEQFRRMLLSKLGAVFDTACGEVESFSRAASAQVEAQLRERRTAFKRRRESLERIQAAAGELDHRLAELEAGEQHLQALAAESRALCEALRAQARHGAAAWPATVIEPHPGASDAQAAIG